MKNNRLFLRMKALSEKKEKVFSAFLTLGYPNLAVTEKLILGFDKHGVDVIELGFPFSDPLADGPTIQYSSEQAIEKGISIEDAFDLVSKVRKMGCEIPIVFFTYINPIFHFGLNAFVDRAKKCGMDGVLVPDLPIEEEKMFQARCKTNEFAQIFLITPTTKKNRIAKIAKASSGFIYYVSLRGVTGARASLPSDIKRCVGQIQSQTQKPVLIGFGVSSPKQSRQMANIGDGVIVGSAIIEKLRTTKGQVGPTVEFVSKMVKAAKGLKS